MKESCAFEDYFTLQEVSHQSNTPYSTLQYWITKGKLKVKKWKTLCLVHRDEVEEIIRKKAEKN